MDRSEIAASFANLIDEALGHEEEMASLSNTRPDRPRAILAMPEMQAIRRLVKALGDSCWEDAPLLDKAWSELPPAVDEWAEI